MTILLQFTYRAKAIFFRILTDTYVEIDKVVLNCTWKLKGFRLGKVGGYMLPI
jgi:hypothetical protein